MLCYLIQKLLKIRREARVALRQESLRQHYLEQVQRVCCAPAQALSAFASRKAERPVGSPVIART
jgi:hypothetical protein